MFGRVCGASPHRQSSGQKRSHADESNGGVIWKYGLASIRRGHDSVMDRRTIIRSAAGDPLAVAVVARAQEIGGSADRVYLVDV